MQNAVFKKLRDFGFSKPAGALAGLALLSLGLASTAHAAEQQADAGTSSTDVDYGEMYVIQKRETPRKSWESLISYSFAFSNPYISTHGVNVGLDRRLGDFFKLGISGHYFQSAERSLTKDLEANLAVQNVQTTVYKPRYSAYANFTLVPLSGLLNLFNIRSADFDLDFTLGAGVASYSPSDKTTLSPSIRLAFAPKVMFTQNLGASIGINSTFDRLSGNDWQNRIETLVGLVARF